MHQRTKMIAVARHWRKCTKKTTCISIQKKWVTLFLPDQPDCEQRQVRCSHYVRGPCLENKVRTPFVAALSGSGEGKSDERPRTQEQAWPANGGFELGIASSYGLSLWTEFFLLACLECVIAVTLTGKATNEAFIFSSLYRILTCP